VQSTKGVYNGGGRAQGPYAAVSKLGLGKAAFIGDSSPVEDVVFGILIMRSLGIYPEIRKRAYSRHVFEQPEHLP